MYNDYLNNTLDTNSFFTDEDKYILPSNIRAKIIEKNSFNYFQLKTKLKSAPDLLIKLKDKNTYFETNNQDKLLTFNEYINQIQLNFDYLEIDGALINDSEEIIYLRHEEIDKPILAYKEINFKNNICELGTKDNKNKVLKIPANSVVFFQTIIKGPIMKLNGNDFDKTMLHLNEMKDELAAILYKMIIYNKYFYELYIKLGLINEKSTLLFFLIFDDYPNRDISVQVKQYIDIFITKNLLDYSFIIQPIYMSFFIDKMNWHLKFADLDNKYKDMKIKYEYLKKKIIKLKSKDKNDKNIEISKEKKDKEEEDKIKGEQEKELKKKEEEVKKKNEEEKNKNEELIKREKELKKREDEINELNKKEDEIIKKEEAIKKRENEIARRENELKKKEIEIIKKEEEVKIKNLNNSYIKECDEEAVNYAKSIKKDAEAIVGFEFKKYKPIGYNKKLIKNKEYYSFKIKIGKNKYIHVLKEDIRIFVIFGKKLFKFF